MKPPGNSYQTPSLLGWLRAGSDRVEDLTPLEQMGLSDPEQCALNLMRLGTGSRSQFWEANEDILSRAISRSPDPDLSVSTLQRIDETADIHALLRDPEDIGDLALIVGASPFLGDLLVKDSSSLGWLFRSNEIDKASDEGVASINFHDLGPGMESKALLRALNRVKRRELLRIGARGCLGYSSMEEEFGALSGLADSLLDRILDLCWPGDIPMPSIIALGKLGGHELNYSSDIDLIFALPLSGSPDLVSILPRATRGVERIVEALTCYTPDGSLYRVDLRLRPGGERAPLIRTVRWIESYYAGQGNPWERQVMVKARVCAGDIEGGRMLLNILQPFIYPVHAERDPGDEAHRLRRERRAREGTRFAEDHVKLAPGTIRDVEFIVQVLQLLYGGRRPEIRDTATLSALEKLRQAGLLPGSEATELTDAYLFMRRLEHFLQIQENRQTFTLPKAPSRRRAVARLMGFGDINELLKRYNSHRSSVLDALNTLLPGTGEEETGEPVESLLNLPPGGVEAARRLRERGFRKPEHSHRVLLATGSESRSGGRNAWAAFIGLLPNLLKDAVSTGAPDRAINNLERILRRLGSPGAYTGLLAREAPLRKALLTLCASGALLTDLLLRHPEHFERLFSTGAAHSAEIRAEWRRRLRQVRHRANSSHELVTDLESLRTREFLASGLAYAMGEQSPVQTMKNLGLLAKDLIRCFLGIHFQEFLNPPQVGVFSLGTLSARHMTFSSDADLLFIHSEGSGATIQSLAARVAGLLSPPDGPYPVDMRLRPEGRSAPTSVDTEYLRSYLEERASPWEALALSRINTLYGKKSLLDGARDVIEGWLENFHLDDKTIASLRGVRQHQENELTISIETQMDGGSFFDVKHSPGALSDIEYIVLGLSLDRWRKPQPRSAHILDLIPPLVKEGALSIEEGDLLAETYLDLRTIQFGLQLHYGRNVTRLPFSWPEEEQPVFLKDETTAQIKDHAPRVRELFEKEFPVSRS